MTSPRRKSSVMSKFDVPKAGGKKVMKSGKVSEILYDVGSFTLVKMPLPFEVATIEYVFPGSSNSNKN